VAPGTPVGCPAAGAGARNPACRTSPFDVPPRRCTIADIERSLADAVAANRRPRSRPAARRRAGKSWLRPLFLYCTQMGVGGLVGHYWLRPPAPGTLGASAPAHVVTLYRAFVCLIRRIN